MGFERGLRLSDFLFRLVLYTLPGTEARRMPSPSFLPVDSPPASAPPSAALPTGAPPSRGSLKN